MSSSKQLHSLEQFLAQAQGPSLSWADVDDDPELYATVDEPALEPIEEVAPPSRSSRHPIPNLPRSPPFVIYCGNLSYNCTEQHLNEFFAPIKPVETRIVVDPSTKSSKGFGYVEFRTRDDMEQAFDRNAQFLLSRPIRIDVQNNRENASDRPPRHHAPPMPAVPAERPKLVLKPRSVDTNKPLGSTPTPKVNPFGAARPREEVLKEKAAASTTTEEHKTAEQKSAIDKRSRSPAARSRVPPAPTQQKSAWGPVRSVMPKSPPSEPVTTPKEPQQQRPATTPKEPQQQRPATTPKEPQQQRPSTTPREPQQQRPAWGPRRVTPRADAEQDEQRSARPTPTNRGHHIDSRQQGPSNSRLITPQNAGHDRKGPVRHHDRPVLRQQNGGDRKGGPRTNSGDHRPRHRHDDHRGGSRDKPHEPESTSDAAQIRSMPKSSPTERARSQSPSHANADDAGFEMQRKGRRNGSGLNAAGLSSTMSKINLNTNRTEKSTDKLSSRQRAPAAEIPSSVAYSSNIFASLANLNDE